MLEGLVALAALVAIVSLIVTAIDQGRIQEAKGLRQQEVLNLAQMAVQTQQNQLQLNGLTVTVERSDLAIRVYHEGEEVLHVQKK